MQGNIALCYGQLIAKLWGNVRGPLAPFELRVCLKIELFLIILFIYSLGFSCKIWFITFYSFSTT